MRLFNMIWVDYITAIQKKVEYENSWKRVSFTIMTTAMVFNFVFISVVILLFFDINTSIVHVKLFSSKMLNASSSSLINYFLPAGIINYFLIFFRDRYLKLLKKYKTYNGMLFISYLVVSVLLLIGFVLLYNHYKWYEHL